MPVTELALGEVLVFGRSVRPDLPAVDSALAAVRALLRGADVPYVVVGGLAVLHHGYVRATRDVDVLLLRSDADRMEPLLAAGGFERRRASCWRHANSGVDVDLLFAGEPIPPHGGARFPAPLEVARSPREPDVISLPPLLELKLLAGRHQDVADVVGLVQGLDEGSYLEVEAAVGSAFRPRLAALRADALEERRWRDPAP